VELSSYNSSLGESVAGKFGLEFNQNDNVHTQTTIDEKGKIGLSIKQLQEKKAEETAEAPARERSSFRAPRNNFGGRDFRKPNRYSATSASFEDKLSKFLKDSDERLTDLRRKTDSKRGGRGSRRD
jgi:S1 RNA binding domain protein